MRRVRLLSYYFFFLMAGLVFADPTGRLRGSVKDPSGKPIEGVTLTIVAQGDMPQTYTAHTDKKGEYLHIGVRPGRYRITPTKDGYLPVQYGYIDADVTLAEKPLNADFVMQVQQAAAPSGQPEEAAKQQDDMAEARNAVALLDEGKVDEAIVALKKVNEAKPGNASVLYDLGVAYEKKDMAEDAQKQYQAAIAANPQLGDAYLALGNSLLSSKKFDAASDALKKATELMPESYPAFYNLGVSYSNGGKYPEAEGAYRKACEISPKEPVAHYQLAMSLLGQSKNGEAKTEFQKYLELNPNAADKQDVLDLLQTLQ